MSAKILITGVANSGKTSLVKTLKNALVLSRDGKKCPLEMYHKNLEAFTTVDTLIEEMTTTINNYKETIGDYPETIVIDSISRIATEIEISCDKRFKGFDVWKNVSSEIDQLRIFVEELTDISNVVIIAHCIVGEDGKTTEVCKGSFAKAGGFLSTVDYAINISVAGRKRKVTHKNHEMARSLLAEVPDFQDVADFNLQDYIDKIQALSLNVSKWSLS